MQAPPTTTETERRPFDTAGWLAENDVVYRSPAYDFASLPIGNGRLTAMVWNYEPIPEPLHQTSVREFTRTSSDAEAAEWHRRPPPLGLAIQLTRTDTFDEKREAPQRRSAGRLWLPDVGASIDPDDFEMRLRFETATVQIRTGSFQAEIRVDAHADALLVRLRGLEPRPQRVVLELWEGRAPVVSADGGRIALAESFGEAPRTFGAAVVVAASSPATSREVGERRVELDTSPDASGSLVLTVAVPSIAEHGADAFQAAAPILDEFEARGPAATHEKWWEEYWSRSHIRLYDDGDAPAVREVSSSSSAPGTLPASVVDGNAKTAWSPDPNAQGPHWLELQFSRPTELAQVAVTTRTFRHGHRCGVYLLEDLDVEVPADDGTWQTIGTARANGHWDAVVEFAPVTSDRLRIVFLHSANPDVPTIEQLEVHGPDGSLALRPTLGDDTGRYLQSLWVFNQYLVAIAQHGAWPLGGLQGPFKFRGDETDWGSWFWHYNTRLPTASLYAADRLEWVAPYEDFYLRNLPTFVRHVQSQFGFEAAGVSETLESTGRAVSGMQASGNHPTAMIFSTGPEISYNLWRHYRYATDPELLDRAYEFMKQVALFHLNYAKARHDGRMHVFPAHSQESYREIADPVPDLAAIRVTFPIVARLARERGDDALADQLELVVARLADWPVSPEHDGVLRAGMQPDFSGPVMPQGNGQIPELDAVWPWDLAGPDTGEFSDLCRRTFRYRPVALEHDWAPDAIWAARLGLAMDVRRALVWGTQAFQTFPSGFSNDYGRYEHSGVLTEWPAVAAVALTECALQSHEEVIRIAPAWPADWSGSFSLLATGGHKVTAEVKRGVVARAVIETRAGGSVRVASPWPGESWRVVEQETVSGDRVHHEGADDVVGWEASPGAMFRIERRAGDDTHLFADADFRPATGARFLGAVRVGLEERFELGEPDHPSGRSNPYPRPR